MGQASLEYVGAVTLVALVLSVTAAVGALDGVGRTVAGTFERGLCLVSGSVCSSEQARSEGLEPCPVRTRSNGEDAGVSLGVVRLGRGDALAIERRSDGTASVSFLDGWKGGAEAGVGVRFTPLGLSGSARGGGGLTFTGGATWDFPSWAAADAFVRRYARHETLTGELKGRLCLWCGKDDPPPAHARFHEGGLYGDAALDAGLKVAGRGGDLRMGLEAATVIGRRTQGSRRTTYIRVAGESVGRLGAVMAALGTDGAGEAVLALTSEGGRPSQLRVSVSAELGVAVEALGGSADLGSLARAISEARAGGSSGGGLAGEASVALDLRDPANLEVAQGVVAGLRSPQQLGSRMAALGSRMDSDGTLDFRVYRAGLQRDETGADAALGLRFGAAYERVERGRELLRAWTSIGGGALRERDDCTAATALAGKV